ncbi:ATP-binding protein [Streptomyces sp. NPDC002845]
MRRRLLVVYLLMLAAVLTAVAVPYAAATAARDTQGVFIDQLNDTARFASLAEPALRTGETVALRAELTRYDELFGVGAAVLDVNEKLLLTSRDELPLTDEAVRRRMAAALSDERSGFDQVVWPWRQEPLVLAEPVGRGGEVIGVVVTVAPTDELRSRILRQWALLAAAAVTALVLSTLAAVALARWTLRPVRDLDSAAHEITAGTLDARVPEDAGPVELRRLANSFNVMADTVTGALTQQRSFVAQASHQLRTPLGVLRLRVENLAEHLRPSGSREHSLTLAETVRLARILGSLLALARAEGGRYEIEEVDVEELARERLAAWETMAGELGVRLRCVGGVRGPVLAAVDVLEQAVDALIDNALKFGGEGGEVVLRLAEHDGMAEIHVIDHGAGLDEQGREHATENFWRSPAHQNVAGSGLGLSIVTKLMTACGGDLVLLQAEPHGLDARLRLRLAQAPEGREPAEAHEVRA